MFKDLIGFINNSAVLNLADRKELGRAVQGKRFYSRGSRNREFYWAKKWVGYCIHLGDGQGLSDRTTYLRLIRQVLI